jgi:hypothetical protein
MNAKKWLFSLLFFTISLSILIELKYQIYPGSRHRVDYLVNEYLPALNNENYETLILGDSLAHNAFGNLLMKENLLDLTSNQAISMAGNYFLLKRYLKNNKNPKNIYLFCISDFLHNDLNQVYTYSYFESVFINEEEIEEIKKIKPDLYNMDFDINKYIERRKKSIDLVSYKPKERLAYINIDERSLKKVPNYMNKEIQNNIAKAEGKKLILENIPKIYLDKIIDLSVNKDINFTLIIGPMPEEKNSIFKASKWNEYLIDKKINYFNVNDYYTFSNYFFRSDGVHIKGKVNQYYQNIINENILELSIKN